MITIGSVVRVLPPFHDAFPDTYVVSAVRNDADSTCTINDDNPGDGFCIDRDFAMVYLELAE